MVTLDTDTMKLLQTGGAHLVKAESHLRRAVDRRPTLAEDPGIVLLSQIANGILQRAVWFDHNELDAGDLAAGATIRDLLAPSINRLSELLKEVCANIEAAVTEGRASLSHVGAASVRTLLRSSSADTFGAALSRLDHIFHDDLESSGRMRHPEGAVVITVTP